MYSHEDKKTFTVKQALNSIEFKVENFEYRRESDCKNSLFYSTKKLLLFLLYIITLIINTPYILFSFFISSLFSAKKISSLVSSKECVFINHQSWFS